MREHSRRPRGEKGARAGRGLSTDTVPRGRGGGGGSQIRRNKKTHTPNWMLSSSPATGRTFQPGPIQAALSSDAVSGRTAIRTKACKAEAAGGCGPAERGVTTELALAIGPSGPPEYAPPVRQRAVRRSRRAGGAPSVRRRSRRVGGAPGRPRPTSDEEIRHAVEGRSGSRAPAKRATSFHGERARAACVITCQK